MGIFIDFLESSKIRHAEGNYRNTLLEVIWIQPSFQDTLLTHYRINWIFEVSPKINGMSGNLSEENLGSDAFFLSKVNFIFFQSLNSIVTTNLSTSSIKKVVFGSFPRQNDDLLVLWGQPKKKLGQNGIRTHAGRNQPDF